MLGIVAPYVGAWIETPFPLVAWLVGKSHPTWVRGLKPKQLKTKIKYNRSHPTWVRGLKLWCNQLEGNALMSHPTLVRGLKPSYVPVGADGKPVAPYVGAWIETLENRQVRCLFPVAPYVGAFIESKDKGTETFGIFVPPRMLHL